jgi:hypothetical protein
MRRDQDKTKADGGNQRHMIGMAPDRQRELRKAADDNSRERHAIVGNGTQVTSRRLSSHQWTYPG